MKEIKSKLLKAKEEVLTKRTRAYEVLETAEEKYNDTQAQVMYWEQRYEAETTEAVGAKLDEAYDKHDEAYAEHRRALEPYDTLEEVYRLITEAIEQLDDYEDWKYRNTQR